jgi:hypothetical protein
VVVFERHELRSKLSPLLCVIEVAAAATNAGLNIGDEARSGE